ncbi:nucleotide exchange factor GrpE [Natrononativus amylolyticus]|uniref:nucleotide exchange factor GrpE n=1 Tax=Natrononativus amylolyticus TaxID=2963434 RepID=UPI0020CDA63A|nr:nucleotide exchange factor GrpE [Natrononativus amylolyticus]
MSEDEGMNAASQDVPSGKEPDEETDAEATRESPSESDLEAEIAPETSDDVQDVLDRVAQYDDDLAREVGSIAETARETVSSQRAELEDLRERVDAQAETIEELQEELEARERTLSERDEQIEELTSTVKRTQADFQNYKKRAKKRQNQLEERATEDLVSRLVGVRDNLKRALEEESDDVESLREGVEMTMREFDRVLEEENVAEIEPEPGAAVDPQRHEVMVQVDSAHPEGTVADVFTPGYEMGGKVIQNAQVTVSNGELDGEPSAEESETDEASAGDRDDAAPSSRDE